MREKGKGPVDSTEVFDDAVGYRKVCMPGMSLAVLCYVEPIGARTVVTVIMLRIPSGTRAGFDFIPHRDKQKCLQIKRRGMLSSIAPNFASAHIALLFMLNLYLPSHHKTQGT